MNPTPPALHLLFRKPFRFVAVLIVLGVLYSVSHGEDDPQELSDARESFKKEVEFATRSIRDRYLTKLDALKRGLGNKGDFHGALAVEQEMDRVKASALEAAGVEKFAGTWKIHYSTNNLRNYVINLDGYVTYKEPTRVAKGKIAFRNSQYLLEFGDGSIERLTLTGNTLNTEIFVGKSELATGTSISQGTGVREVRAK